MQFAEQGGLTIPITWYFAPKRAKLCDTPTAFGSSNWDWIRGLTYDLGEQREGPRTYSKGSNPWGYIGQCRVGSNRAYALGLSPEDLARPLAVLPDCCRPVTPAVGTGGLAFNGVAPVLQTAWHPGGLAFDGQAPTFYAGDGGLAFNGSSPPIRAGEGGIAFDGQAPTFYAGDGGLALGDNSPVPVFTDACSEGIPSVLVGVVANAGLLQFSRLIMTYQFLPGPGVFGWQGTSTAPPIATCTLWLDPSSGLPQGTINGVACSGMPTTCPYFPCGGNAIAGVPPAELAFNMFIPPTIGLTS
jgi:hypothetical protein